MSEINYPTVQVDAKKKVFVSFYLYKKRYRLYNSKRIGGDFNPNSFPEHKRLEMGNILAYKVYNHISKGGRLTAFKSNKLICGEYREIEYITQAYNNKLQKDYSVVYKRMFKGVYRSIVEHLLKPNNSVENIGVLLEKHNCKTTYNTVRRHMSVLLNDAVKLGLKSNPLLKVSSKKERARLHKPIRKIKILLNELEQYNFNLYLCCLMTYGCLLRPHREIRQLSWESFSDDLKFINLSGKDNKSGRNRIVPVPEYIRAKLKRSNPNHNIFTNSETPPNPHYFCTLWGRFKSTSKHLKKGQTLYSFRHTGAIEIFKRTGSITKLQKAMGHSSINVSLTYLRGLEIPELKEEDMPLIK